MIIYVNDREREITLKGWNGMSVPMIALKTTFKNFIVI